MLSEIADITLFTGFQQRYSADDAVDLVHPSSSPRSGGFRWGATKPPVLSDENGP